MKLEAVIPTAVCTLWRWCGKSLFWQEKKATENADGRHGVFGATSLQPTGSVKRVSNAIRALNRYLINPHKMLPR